MTENTEPSACLNRVRQEDKSGDDTNEKRTG